MSTRRRGASPRRARAACAPTGPASRSRRLAVAGRPAAGHDDARDGCADRLHAGGRRGAAGDDGGRPAAAARPCVHARRAPRGHAVGPAGGGRAAGERLQADLPPSVAGLVDHGVIAADTPELAADELAGDGYTAGLRLRAQPNIEQRIRFVEGRAPVGDRGDHRDRRLGRDAVEPQDAVAGSAVVRRRWAMRSGSTRSAATRCSSGSSGSSSRSILRATTGRMTRCSMTSDRRGGMAGTTVEVHAHGPHRDAPGGRRSPSVSAARSATPGASSSTGSSCRRRKPGRPSPTISRRWRVAVPFAGSTEGSEVPSLSTGLLSILERYFRRAGRDAGGHDPGAHRSSVRPRSGPWA